MFHCGRPARKVRKKQTKGDKKRATGENGKSERLEMGNWQLWPLGLGLTFQSRLIQTSHLPAPAVPGCPWLSLASMRFRFQVLRRVRVSAVPACPGTGITSGCCLGLRHQRRGILSLSVLHNTLFTLLCPPRRREDRRLNSRLTCTIASRSSSLACATSINEKQKRKLQNTDSSSSILQCT